MSEPTTYGEKVAAADAARTPLDDPKPKQPKQSIDDLMLRISSRRWLAIRRAMDATSTEILNDIVMQLTVAANEKHRGETGRDDWDRFLDMGFKDLSLFLDLISEDEAADPKSDAADRDEPRGDTDRPAAVGAAGGGDGLPAGEGPVVSGDGPAA